MNIVNYKYHFATWDQFVAWLMHHGFKRYEYGMPCRRGYTRGNIDIKVPYYSSEFNRIEMDGELILEFTDPTEISQDIFKSWAL